MTIALLTPRVAHSAIEERYASWQSRMILGAAAGVSEHLDYDPAEPAARVVAGIQAGHVLVLTDPLLLGSTLLPARLRAALSLCGAQAAVPAANAGDEPRQRRDPPALYLTLRELQAMTERMAGDPLALERVAWGLHDPGVFLCSTGLLRTIDRPMRDALSGLDVAISTNDYVHRWSSLRGQTRVDLLERVGLDAKSILEFGCGEAPLGEALKKRQPCRVVGIELDPAAAAIAAKRIDVVYQGDAREVVSRIDETFDWIVGGDIVEHLQEPWSFLSDLRCVAAPGASLLLSIPNLANASIVGDLIQGRFDYVYMGLTCVGHLRFFTRRTIEDMLNIAGWQVAEISPQMYGMTPQGHATLASLDAQGIAHSKNDLTATGYYVVARNAS